ncbi:hypothetical protein GCM10022394_02010 [Zobellella aerophila]|uniref:Uncharacterized protein n=1 Tax=Zobellella aerophila TaxID=870480 RepID=A0ABP6V3I3_9GAMM
MFRYCALITLRGKALAVEFGDPTSAFSNAATERPGLSALRVAPCRGGDDIMNSTGTQPRPSLTDVI